MSYERTVRYAIDSFTGEIYDSNEIFHDRTVAFTYREKYNRREIAPICIECKSELSISTSEYSRIHFKHYPNSAFCELKAENISPLEKEILYNILVAKESDRHKYLKNLIGQKLSLLPQVQDVNIDSKYITDQFERRRPDVSCNYDGKKIVFEIQLSDLSQRYILGRQDFYRRNNIFLVWILDNFEVHGQSQTEKDIKYLFEHQNFFNLDDVSESLRLKCTFKQTFLNEANNFYDQWTETSVALSQLTFNTKTFEAYFYDFGEEKKTLLEIQAANKLKIDAEIIRIKKQKELSKIKLNVESLLKKIKCFKDNRVGVYTEIMDILQHFDEQHCEILNERLKLNQRGSLIDWFSAAKNEDVGFLTFILTTYHFEYDLNLVSDKNGRSVVDHMLGSELSGAYKFYYFKLALKRGYHIKKNDEAFINNYHNRDFGAAERFITISYLAKEFENPIFIEYLFKHERAVCFIESAKRDRVIGYNYKNNEWINLANNILEYYPKYWEYIEVAFKHYGTFEKLVKLDKNRTFQKKLTKYYSEEIKTDYSFEYLFSALYPELNYLTSNKIY